MELFIQLLINGLVVGALYALIGVSWGVIYATTKVFHFAHALALLVAAYSGIVVANLPGVPFWCGFIVAPVVAVIIGVLSEICIYRPMRRASAKQFNIFLASLGLLQAGNYTMQIIFGANPLPVNGGLGDAFSLGFVTVTANDLLWFVVSAVVIAIFLIWLRYSEVGHSVRAVATNPDLSYSIGISPDRIYVAVFLVGSAMVGVAGFLLALSRGGSLDMGLVPVLAGFAATFLGGVGRYWGAVLAGLLLGVSEQLSGLFLAGQWETVTAFSVLIVVLMLRPQGLFATRK